MWSLLPEALMARIGTSLAFAWRELMAGLLYFLVAGI
jgi:hypothetical protein